MSVKQKLLKGIMCWAAACLMAVMCCGQALAAASAQPVRVFVYENTLYTYVKLDGIDRPVTQVEAKIGSQSFGTSTRLETVRTIGGILQPAGEKQRREYPVYPGYFGRQFSDHK